jgi:hypothetical protein
MSFFDGVDAAVSDPYAITPDVLTAYREKYGSAPSSAAVSLYNSQNANYYAGDATASGSVAGAGLPGTTAGTTGSASNKGGLLGVLGGLGDFFFSPSFSPSAASADIQSGAAGNSTTGAILTSAGSAISFITDIPRVTTTLLGLILIIAGIFALSRGPAVQIVGGALKEAATS